MYQAPVVRGRRFLFLQGPHGPFFHLLAERLRLEGHAVERINLNGGDRHDWQGQGHDYTGGTGQWPMFVDDFIRQHDITDLILYGDCRPLHRAAHGIARRRGCRIHVFEEGYIRPDFMTLERDGVNGNSALPGDPHFYLNEARGLPPIAPLPGVPASFERRLQQVLAYHVASLGTALRFRRYRSHRPHNMAVEAAGWMRRALTRSWAMRRSARTLERLGTQPFFLLPLQLSSDHQIRTHSPFAGMEVATDYILQSFAAHAPGGTLLVIKQHPLAYDLRTPAAAIARQARRLNIAGRVMFVEEADLDLLIGRTLGMVTVNSTAGTLALRRGIPTMVLGHAVYDMPLVTHQGSLDGFWLHPQPPQADVYV
ncbi:MAG TPA: capsular biosynthesis protein [Devosia sp.]|jgi:capsular polysaccharide export protein|uniref:capsule biosynthesis protein n=1 Tax=unclassified Sphingomonas TaxID=196159 RepID=UPI000DBC19E2|nr:MULTISPECIES: capsular biosynthesis protein [unclassified Sphingomonas]PZT90825.1 MAG: capsular biosynthesis protein [Sphingomonas sp.]RSV29519.1 capsular biosynthesis protein [Sphingomonas sp. ABOLH]HEV7291550.1 capsular biosynthesis protein [Devosia sp.]